ncbi:FmdB family transcriptional regulator [Nocardioides psychrotolerans]|uniref:Putative regulatory protein, FmdB family n=1 Tax=Nocardioides psychrotolerans TaxID=1005945 RepID=A0A1I3RSF9_9ACTN|nr:FmdB family zinc ribbon protein [Nocardioides psychrotolerans]GEP40636.1 FmdB family transcriptional regulator [Nocardioides psychrotolerans]SFJ48126.1 putative regulatory protein, FmdB family [Nocardioides psychrotolerans]
MPTYQYACTECGHDLEQFQSFNDDSLTECPQCQGKLRKVFNAVGVVFKGSGFYRTDSRASSTASEPAAASSGGESSGKGKSDTTSDKPAAAKPEGKGKSDAKPAAAPQAS